MKSMTGYANSETVSGRYSIFLELKSYNNRYLDIQVNLPPHYGVLEPRFREKISKVVERGRVECSCRVKETEEDLRVVIDTKNAEIYAQALRDLAKAAGISSDVSLGHLLRMEGVLGFEKNKDNEDFWGALEPVLDRVVEDFEKSRTAEGSRTRDYILGQLEDIRRVFSIISDREETLESLLSKHLKERFEEIVDKQVDESRIASETAVLLMKYSIGEEIERFRGHIESFHSILEDDRGSAKKLDFICQELNREINTIASKSFLLEINQAVVNIKDGIEKIREQLRNVE